MLISEIWALFRRTRVRALLGVLFAIPVLLAVAVKLSGGPSAGNGPTFLDRVSHNGVFAALADSGVPRIHFGVDSGHLLESMAGAGADVVGVDWRTSLADARARLGPDVAVQGNLDPVVLFADLPEIERQTRRILEQAGGRPGHIFNLGHGILPETPIEHVSALVRQVRSFER